MIKKLLEYKETMYYKTHIRNTQVCRKMKNNWLEIFFKTTFLNSLVTFFSYILILKYTGRHIT
jgi:hypothetical protein